MQNDLKEYAKQNAVPIIQDEGLKFLLNCIQTHKCKKILELGTAIAYSSIAMARLNPEISIITLERNPLMYQQALNNIKQAELEKQIKAIQVDIPSYQTNEEFDLIFVDAGKGHYLDYLNQFIKNLKKDGIMVFDNLNFHGMVYNVDEIKNRNTRSLVKKINRFYETVRNDENYDIQLYREVGDGMLVLKRRNHEK